MAQESKYAVQITRKGVVVWIALLFFVMGWMFVLGIMVGRGTAPVPLGAHALEKELAALKAAMLQQEQAQLETQAKSTEDKSAQLGFYEELKKPPPAPPQPAPRPPAAAPKPPPEPASRPRPVPPPAKETAPQPRTDQHAGERGRFTIQVAAFREVQSAERLVTALRSKGYQAYQIRMTVGDTGEWFRVRVGAFENRESAEAMIKRLNADQVRGIVIATH